MKYTKGEWRVEVGYSSMWVMEGAEVIAEMADSLESHGIKIDSEANAHLISAAPRMYEGIKEALNILDGKLLVVTNEDLDKLKQIKAILNKAKADS